MKKKVIIYSLLILGLLLGLGLFRDFLFTNINFWLYELYYQRGDFELPASLSSFNSFSYAQLYYFKWVLTVLFSLLYLLVYLLGIWVIFRQKKFLIWTIAAFVFIYVIAGCFYIYGWAFNDLKQGYQFARTFMGFVQSPFLLMLLIPAFMLDKKMQL
ncbi:MAG: hypothetical protein M3Q58_02795 [Bacteroidota bacterium]|nr:hypothetical protein [Bacteroidota bacterium]